MRSQSAESQLSFEVAEEPKPGQVRVLLDFGGNTELLHLAESVTVAELWVAKEGYRKARLEIVREDNERAGGVDRAALEALITPRGSQAADLSHKRPVANDPRGCARQRAIPKEETCNHIRSARLMASIV
jgi:hypothetical protein